MAPVFIALALASCNTMQGMGRDVQAAGQAVEDEATQTGNGGGGGGGGGGY